MPYIKLILVFTAILFMTEGCSRPAANNESSQTSVITQSLTSKWEGRLVRRPGSTAEDQKIYLVKDGKKRWVTSSEWLRQHAYRFPDEVQVIPGEELAQIPEGAAIQ
jgi:hypothetical protein